MNRDELYSIIREARNTADRSRQEELSYSYNLDVIESLALNEFAHSEILWRIYRTDFGDEYAREGVLRRLAQNPASPSELLSTLACDKSPLIRQCVAENSHTPLGALETLAADPDAHVRPNVASNVNTPEKVLEKLSRDSDSRVLSSVASNPQSSASSLYAVFYSGEKSALSNLAKNPNTPAGILKIGTVR